MRTKVVWLSLLGAMTTVGGMLLAVEGRPAPRVDGMSFAPLAAAGTPNVIESVFRTRTPLDKGRWTGIVIHHSNSPLGNATTIAAEHEAMGLRGLGHHFIIGNGNGMPNGELYVGFRWLEQLPGAHAGGPKGDEHNLHSISICLVGDGNRRSFTGAQYDRLIELTTALCRELDIPPDHVYLHSQIAPTNDPGALFPIAEFRRDIAKR
ncbi:MAG: peptidoglycan recognition family protein [Phycisphaerales bacterium]